MKPSLEEYPVPRRRSQRKLKAKPKKSSTYLPPTVEDRETSLLHNDMCLKSLSSWLQNTFNIPMRSTDDEFVAYYDVYAKNNKRLERRCFSCKEPALLADSFICSASKCYKVYHNKCLPSNYSSHLCPAHFCSKCRTRVKSGRYCYMCPTTYCASCDSRSNKGRKHLSLCNDCTTRCSDGGLLGIINDCLSCKTIATSEPKSTVP